MVRAAAALLAALACAGCTASGTQTATTPECRAAWLNPNPPDNQDCPDATNNADGVHISAMAQFGVGAVR